MMHLAWVDEMTMTGMTLKRLSTKMKVALTVRSCVLTIDFRSILPLPLRVFLVVTPWLPPHQVSKRLPHEELHSR
jgi:hypothetical protein